MEDKLYIEKKNLILESLAKHAKQCRGAKSQFILSSENDISQSIISTVEQAKKDPQLTTVFRLAEAFGLKTWQFIKLVEEDLPENFSMIDL